MSGLATLRPAPAGGEAIVSRHNGGWAARDGVGSLLNWAPYKWTVIAEIVRAGWAYRVR